MTSSIGDYAAIGDGRTVALVGRDGSVDWLCLPDLDSPSTFGAILDADRGGRFRFEPEVPYEAERRYVPSTNVLETVFRTRDGAVRVVDALTLPGTGIVPLRELVRSVEGLSGRVPMAWEVEPRFGYGGQTTRLGWRADVPVATSGATAIALSSWDAGRPQLGDGCIRGRMSIDQGQQAGLVLAIADREPLVLSTRRDSERRLVATIAFWQQWSEHRGYEGPWRDAVLRSALVLKLLIFSPSGALAAAPTTSLPEDVGGERNWDYRFCWVRDATFTLTALLGLGCLDEADAFFWWLMHASQLTRPRLQVLYRLDGGAHARERTLSFAGYRGSSPVRVGNGAVDQLQLDVYGDLFETVLRYAGHGAIDHDVAARLSQTANLVCREWRRRDAGLWEVRAEPEHFTQSKMMCWVALDRASRLADAGQIPARDAPRWRREAMAIREFVDRRCWSEADQTYLRSSDGGGVDASLLLGVLFGYHAPDDPRLATTIDAVTRELADGPLLYRYRHDDGLSGSEGAFLACSFWLVEALARVGRLHEASELMDELMGYSNDVGLYSEEFEPTTGELVGNFPQALTHLALINAALALAGSAS